MRLTGVIDDRFAARTIRVAPEDLATLAEPLPAPVAITTGTAGEPVEGSRVAVSGTVTEARQPSPTASASRSTTARVPCAS